LHTLPSEHGVPFSTGAVAQPNTGSQVSVVHTLASLQLSARPATQKDPRQVSLPLHTLPSGHGVPPGTVTKAQPLAGLQPSVVQALPSLQTSGVPPLHVPLWQLSAPLQALPSRQGVPLARGAFAQPKTALQVSPVHGLPSPQASGVPAAQAPAWQVSLPLQTVPSAQGVPLSIGVCAHPLAGVQVSVVHALASLQSSGGAAVQDPL
jgi:hypothetical protein